jgi:hypothetical protein
MKKILTLCILLNVLLTLNLYAQKFWECKDGNIRFFSQTPVEDIEANNVACQAVLNTETGDIAFQVPMKSFKFKNSLMEEHFHENYLETDKKVERAGKAEYPNRSSNFQGKMTPNVDLNKPGNYQVKAKGKLRIHSVDVEREFTGTLEVKADRTARLKSTMEVPLVDHKIERPQLMLVKIAEKIRVDVNFLFRPKP